MKILLIADAASGNGPTAPASPAAPVSTTGLDTAEAIIQDIQSVNSVAMPIAGAADPALVPELAIASGALDILAVVLPKIQAMSASGTITVEQQAAVAAKYQALIGADAFSGPEWQQD